MGLYAIGDLHLSLSVNKPMDIFGEVWKDHTEKLRASFRNCGMMIPLCCAGTRPGEFRWRRRWRIFAFWTDCPGRKILLKGNHDYWWETAAKMNAFLQSMKSIRSSCCTTTAFTMGIMPCVVPVAGSAMRKRRIWRITAKCSIGRQCGWKHQ